MGKDNKNDEPKIDFGLLVLGIIFVALGLSPAYFGTFMQYAPCLNNVPFGDRVLYCTGNDYLIGGWGVAAAWAYFLGVGIILGAAAFVPVARIFVRVGFIILLILWTLGIFGIKLF